MRPCSQRDYPSVETEWREAVLSLRYREVAPCVAGRQERSEGEGFYQCTLFLLLRNVITTRKKRRQVTTVVARMRCGREMCSSNNAYEESERLHNNEKWLLDILQRTARSFIDARVPQATVAVRQAKPWLLAQTFEQGAFPSKSTRRFSSSLNQVLCQLVGSSTRAVMPLFRCVLPECVLLSMYLALDHRVTPSFRVCSIVGSYAHKNTITRQHG